MFVQDARLGLRSLRRQPGFFALAVLTLGVGIGATVSIFTVLDAAFFRAPSYREPARLASLYVSVQRAGAAGPDSIVWSYPKFETMRQTVRSFEAVAGHQIVNMNMTGNGDPERLRIEVVSGSYFELLGIQPVIGRAFGPEDDVTPGAHPVIVLGHGLWQRRFGADPTIVGRTVQMNDVALTVLGVAPRGFYGLANDAEAWVPLTMVTELAGPGRLEGVWSHWMRATGRLAPGVTLAQAQQEMATVSQRLEELYPLPFASDTKWGAVAGEFDRGLLSGPVRNAVWVLFGAVLLVLLIACVNIANLLLARAALREREIAVRLALGARRSRLVRQLLTESVILALAGGVLGTLLAYWGVEALAALAPGIAGNGWQIAGESLRLEGSVLAFALLLSLGTGVLFGLVPAIQGSRATIGDVLREGARGSGSGQAGARVLGTRSLLVMSEVALAIVLLAGAGLVMRSFARLSEVNFGFQPESALSVRLAPSARQLPVDQATAFYDRLLAEVSALPGVRSATITQCMPLGIGSCSVSAVLGLDGRPAEPGEQTDIGVQAVDAEFLRTMAVPLRRGRFFTATDDASSPPVVVLNETAARTIFPGEDPIGRTIQIGVPLFGQGRFGEVIGVVGDVRYRNPENPAAADAYISSRQAPSPGAVLLVKTAGDPTAIVPGVRALVRAINPNIPLFDIRTMEERLNGVLARARFSSAMLAIFAGCALLLAAIGLYGVMAYAVVQRTREIGIRVALGAERRTVVGGVVRQAMTLVAVGIVVGLGASLALSRLLGGMLYETSAVDPATFLVVPLVLAAVALAASVVPAWLATRIEPATALRYE
ncbi:MAG TPA: ABC transporter permease [Gemmatimonadaceae bacterium]|nr:ABC transporter permease [Gemmatimonadaceae bacterium]